MDIIGKIIKELELSTYLNQYKDDGVEIIKHEEKREYTSDTGYERSFDESRERTDNGLAEKFCLLRWEEIEPRYTFNDFIEYELEFIESFPKEVLKNYDFQISAIIKYLKEAKK